MRYINRRININFHPPLSTLIILSILSCVLLNDPIIGITSTDAFTPAQRSHREQAPQRTPSTAKLHSKQNADEASVERIRVAVFQAPAKSSERTENPLEILTEAADSLRVASVHGVDVVIFPELYLSGGPARAMDREGYELNIVGNLCEELNVACVIGYAERVHESESNDGDDPDGGRGAYNAIAAFHADGSRAGNYRCVSATFDGDVEFGRGHPFVEFLPTVLRLPNRGTPSARGDRREIKAGLLCGSDILSPEHCRHLVRGGAQAVFASTSFANNDGDLKVAERVVPSRAMENGVSFSFANFVERSAENGSEEFGFVGSSAIVSPDGNYLVRGPREEDGDMPSDCGYMIPCEVGTLYAADIDIDSSSPEARASCEGGGVGTIQQSIEHWDLTPRMLDDFVTKRSRHIGEPRETNGFGRESKKKGSRRKKVK